METLAIIAIVVIIVSRVYCIERSIAKKWRKHDQQLKKRFKK